MLNLPPESRVMSLAKDIYVSGLTNAIFVLPGQIVDNVNAFFRYHYIARALRCNNHQNVDSTSPLLGIIIASVWLPCKLFFRSSWSRTVRLSSALLCVISKTPLVFEMTFYMLYGTEKAVSSFYNKNSSEGDQFLVLRPAYWIIG